MLNILYIRIYIFTFTKNATKNSIALNIVLIKRKKGKLLSLLEHILSSDQFETFRRTFLIKNCSTSIQNFQFYLQSFTFLKP